jgi:hypothetical protein
MILDFLQAERPERLIPLGSLRDAGARSSPGAPA